MKVPWNYLQPLWKCLFGFVFLIFVLTVAFFFAGCSSPSGPTGGFATIGKAIAAPFKAVAAPLKKAPDKQPSGANVPLGNAEVASIGQPSNPSASSTQNYGFTKVDEIVYSQPTQIMTETKQPDGSSIIVTENVPAGSKRRSSVQQTVGQVLGAAHEDKSGEIAAKLGSFRAVQYLGALCLLAGALAFFHPALRAIVGGKDSALAMACAGLIMLFGPFIFVQYSNWFFLAVIGVGIYWLAARLKFHEGKLEALTSTPPFPPKP